MHFGTIFCKSLDISASLHGKQTKRGRKVSVPQAQAGYYAGIDFGTSGCRCTVIDDSHTIVQEVRSKYDSSAGGLTSPVAWEQSLWGMLDNLSPGYLADMKAIAIDGTSSTAIIVNKNDGSPIAPAKMYNERQSADIVQLVEVRGCKQTSLPIDIHG